jgi:outer membrane protein OmpA-like peptidoglycan-associated protein
MAVVFVVACTAVPVMPEGAAAAQPSANSQLTRLASDNVDTAGTAGLKPRLGLQTKPMDHGSVFTLGDVLFRSGRADLKPDAVGNLNELVAFLGKYPDRSVAIHGYTDSVGSEKYNQELSERRANSVKAYLAAQGIGSSRLSSSGLGKSDPVADNDSAGGRQQNRRIEVIISSPPAELARGARTAKMLALLAVLESISGTRGQIFP